MHSYTLEKNYVCHDVRLLGSHDDSKLLYYIVS